MSISASLVKELRDRTGLGMMECKKALVETNGDIEAAIDELRKSGLAKADKKADRVAAEGALIMKTNAAGDTAYLVEVNCETDFVGKDDNFVNFANVVANTAAEQNITDVTALMATEVNGEPLEETRRALVMKIGENINVRRVEALVAPGNNVYTYSHGGRIAVAVALNGGDEELGRDVAMHIAATNPNCIDESQVDQTLLDKEREIFTAQAESEGKPAEIIEKMIIGRMKKFLKEITLVGQPFVKDPDQTVEQLLKSKNATVTQFSRLALGEGIEKKVENFAEEVMAQVKAS
jgi:elongation factor Ts